MTNKEQLNSWDAGFPFGKTTVAEIIRKCLLHKEKPFSEVFEFYTEENAEQAIQKRIRQELHTLLTSLEKEIEGGKQPFKVSENMEEREIFNRAKSEDIEIIKKFKNEI